MEWVCSLGEIRTNFKELTIKIPLEGIYHVVKGGPKLARAAASFKFNMKANRDEGQGISLVYQSLEGGLETNTPWPTWLDVVLSKFEVFQKPQGLPSSRRHDHAIVLKEEGIFQISGLTYVHNEIERLYT